MATFGDEFSRYPVIEGPCMPRLHADGTRLYVAA